MIIRFAREEPTFLVKRQVPPAPGMIASLVSGKANFELMPIEFQTICLLPTLKSQLSANSNPPPSANPSSAATVMVGDF